MDYSKVAPPSQSPADHNTAFADALARARQIAAKIGGSETDPAATLKRPYDGIPDSQPESKKMAAVNDPIGAQLKLLQDQQRVQAVQAATNAAAQINAKLGIAGGAAQPTEFGDWQDGGGMPQPEFGDWQDGGVAGMPQASVPMGNNIPGMGGMVTTENYQVPDRMVGLVIGKGGENIAMIQSETGVKVQFAQDSGGMPDRQCTLTGSQEGIAKAKELVQRIISKGQGLPENNMHGGDGVTMEEVMIPGNKVGLVIGKGGENIKQLQEKAGVKMVMIQDSNTPTNVDKPLRITGEPSRVAQAKEMVFDLLAEKEAQAANFGGGGGGGNGNDYGGQFFGGGGGGNKQEVSVPRSLVGVIIGKGGEMIKKITQDTGAKIQLKPDDGQGPERVCMVMGPPDRVQAAVEFISSLLDSANTGGMGRGRGRGREEGGERRPGGNGYAQKEETTYIVPADKTGLVIGKGGETVKEINRVTGAWVELSRDRPPNPHDRVFKVSGTGEQISQALRMVCEKAGLPPPRESRGPGGPPQGFGAGGGGGGGFNQQGSPGQTMGGGPGSQGGGAPQGWGNAYNAGGAAQQPQPQSQWNQGQPQEQPKPPEQNAAAWAAYYQNYYQQQPGGAGGQPGQPPQQPQQPQAPAQAAPQQPQQYTQPQAQPAQQQAPGTINPATGQPDYSAQWAEYYRQQGMHYHAQAILQQAAAAGAQPGQPQQPIHPQ